MSDSSHPPHSDRPLGPVDATALHDAVDRLAAALHEYVDTAVGVRSEFGAHEADEDPRVLALEGRLGTLNAELYDRVHDTLGMHADLTTLAWDGTGAHDEDPTDADDDVPTAAEAFHLGFVVGPPTGPSDHSMDSVLDLIDSGGEELVARLVEAGFDVVEWATSRGEPADFEGFGDDDEEEDE
ncbi:hypothetical protein [uncultured Cellulomonas sp.]|uniref:hypothetical protein n=1 Tax=uncultured Cellulomonas sp. TaxID=189682 RepID=UPI00261F1F00|nr:hypothetical protein [uncultured Cellulomonas sp.]